MRKLNKDIFLSHYLSQETTTGYIPKHIRVRRGKQYETREEAKGLLMEQQRKSKGREM